MLQRFPVIVGPTASGKTTLAVSLAHAYAEAAGHRAEIISADSIQIYRGLDIGAAKPTPEERRDIPHHLIDIREPTDAYTVDHWNKDAGAIIDDLRNRETLPIVCGGTHLYIKALLEGLFDAPPPDPNQRAELLAMDTDLRRRELERVDPIAAQRIHPNDIRRTVRALEVYRQTGTPITEHQRQWDRGAHRSDILLIPLLWPNETLNRRINARVRDMIEQGLIDEARSLWQTGRLGPQAREALGYKQLIKHFEGRAPLDRAIEAIKVETRRFAKNQRTWLRRLSATPGALPIDMSVHDPETAVQLVLQQLLTTT